MERNLERVSLDALMSLQELAASGRADIAALIAKVGTLRERTQRLREQSEQILAEIRVA
jgi:uncharacterized coiled-coil DUF342 family protein